MLPLEHSYSFTGHQSFVFRAGWLVKGVRAIEQYGDIFKQEDAFVKLGVGKNMVRSISHWLKATRLVHSVNGRLDLTVLGTFLFGRDHALNAPPPKKSLYQGHSDLLESQSQQSTPGADPYLEDPASLWLLHWQLTSYSQPASSWFLTFTCWGKTRFHSLELGDWLAGQTRKANRRTISRDVDVLLRTYLSRNDLDTKFRGQIEDSLDRPLASLGLLSRIDRDVFQVSRGNQASLPQAVLTYAIADFWDRYASEQKSISIERLLYDPGSPGAAFRLSDTTLVDHLETLPVDSGFLYDETAGQRKLLRNTFVEPLDHLKQHYRATFH